MVVANGSGTFHLSTCRSNVSAAFVDITAASDGGDDGNDDNYDRFTTLPLPPDCLGVPQQCTTASCDSLNYNKPRKISFDLGAGENKTVFAVAPCGVGGVVVFDLECLRSEPPTALPTTIPSLSPTTSPSTSSLDSAVKVTYDWATPVALLVVILCVVPIMIAFYRRQLRHHKERAQERSQVRPPGTHEFILRIRGNTPTQLNPNFTSERVKSALYEDVEAKEQGADHVQARKQMPLPEIQLVAEETSENKPRARLPAPAPSPTHSPSPTFLPASLFNGGQANHPKNIATATHATQQDAVYSLPLGQNTYGTNYEPFANTQAFTNNTDMYQVNVVSNQQALRPLIVGAPGSGKLPTFQNDRYVGVKKMGAGNFGTCYLVNDTQSDPVFKIIKQIHIGTCDNNTAANAVVEGKLLKHLKHQNVVGYFDVFQDQKEEVCCIVMEFCNGGDLASVVRYAKEDKADIQFPVIMEWFIQLLLGVQYLHSRKVLHRDIKSQNVFITGDPQILKLGDFGIARVVRRLSEQVNTMAGTPQYMSPECLGGEGYNTKSDMWSLGCLIFELCALRLPFVSESILGLVSAIHDGVTPELPPSIDNIEFRTVAQQLLSKDPKLRPSAVDVLKSPLVVEHSKALIHAVLSRKRQDTVKNLQRLTEDTKFVDTSKSARRRSSVGVVAPWILEHPDIFTDGTPIYDTQNANAPIPEIEAPDNDHENLYESIRKLANGSLCESLTQSDQGLEN